MKKIIFTLLFVCMSIALIGCTTKVDPTQISFESATYEIGVGEEKSIVLTYSPSDTTEKEVTYTSSDSSIAKVEDGKIIGVAVGECTITVTSSKNSSVSAQATVKVNPASSKVTSIEVTGASVVYVGKTATLTANYVPANPTDVKINWASSNESIATISSAGVVTGVSAGICVITVTDEVSEVSNIYTIEVKAVATSLVINGETEVTVDEKITLSVTYQPPGNDVNIVYTSSDATIATVDNAGVVTGVKAGTVTITATDEISGLSQTHSVTVKNKGVLATDLNHNIKDSMLVDESYEISVSYVPENATYKNYTIELSDTGIVEIKDNKITALSVGTVTLKIISEDKNVEKTVQIVVGENVAPVISVDTEVTTVDVVLNYNKPFDKMAGVKAIDDLDGDISDQIVCTDEVDNRTMGKYTLRYSVVDSSGNVTRFQRTVEVIFDYAVTFIGHAGSYSGIMNTEEAFINGVTKHGYQALECDLKQTRDGVFVMCHDNDFNGIDLQTTNWADIKDVVKTQTRGSISYSSKICTLERYLEICKEYNVVAVIELKSSNGITNSSQARMQALLNEIEKAGMLNQVVFLGSQYNCLIWTRQNGYDYIPCQYLVNSCESETVLQRCIDYNLDLSFNISNSNSEEWLAKYHAAGLKISCWTFNQYSSVADLQSWIDKGVDYVTVDVIKPYEVDLPEKVVDTRDIFTVTFKDYDGKVLATTKVRDGDTAILPVTPKRTGYTFAGWDKETTNITADTEFTAKYDINTYNITYVKNNDNLDVVTFATKEEFLQAFYTDWFNWLDSQVGKIADLTKSGDTYTLVGTGYTATWTDVASLRALDIYVVQSTIGKYVYQPFTRTENVAYAHPEVEGYFLNTEPYRTNWKDMDGYLLNSMLVQYTSYSRGYSQTSDGRVQIFFRFHQWAKGTTIASLDNYPVKYLPKEGVIPFEVTLPTTPTTYTILSVIDLSTVLAVSDGATFAGWYLDEKCTQPITEIKDSAKDLVLYAKWELKQ